jgi:hypothetical protein
MSPLQNGTSVIEDKVLKKRILMEEKGHPGIITFCKLYLV